VAEIGISEEVKRFLAGNIDSILELEILLLLRAQSARAFAADELARELKIDAAWAAEQLARFATRGFLARTDATPIQYRYAPSGPELDITIAAVAEAYATHRVTIVSLIFSKPVSTIRSFADAFRIRQPGKDRSDG
jgi:hypothetical protein